MTRRQVVVRYWFPAIAWAALMTAGTSLPRVPGPGIAGFDKFSHLVAYAGLGLLLMRAFGGATALEPLAAAGWVVAIGLVYGGLDEWHQTLIPGRSCSVWDFAADAAGLLLAVCGTVVVWRTEHERRMRRQTREERGNMAEALHLDESTFESEVLQSDLPALVDFWAPWCGPCQMMGPTIDKLAGDYEGKAVVAKVNVDNSPDLASKYGIRSIPALLFFKNGEVVDQLVGVQSEDTLKKKLDSLA